MSAGSEYQRRRRDERAQLLAAGHQIVHGVSAYNNWRCRCEVCRAAKSLDNARTREARKQAAS